MTQGELVFQAVLATFGNEQGEFEGPVPSTTEWTKQQKDDVHEFVVQGFLNGAVSKNSGGNDEVSIRKYVPGLVNNWVRKDKRLNGGVKYTPKNPGSRANSGDETLKNLRLLLTVVNAEMRPAVQVEIDKRIEELKPKVELNIDVIPESLRNQLIKHLPTMFVRKAK